MKINTYWAIVRLKGCTCWELNPYRMQNKRTLLKYFEEYSLEYKVIYTEREFEKLGNK